MAFVLFSDATGRIWITFAFLMGITFVLLMLLFNTLTIDGAAAALVTGLIAMGLGKWTGAGLLLFFFISVYLLTIWADEHAERPDKAEIKRNRKVSERRTGIQVWANAFWFTLFLSLFVVTAADIFLIAAAAAIAAATADTWASIVGEHLSDRAMLVTTFSLVPSGTDGGITPAGTLAALTGAVAAGGLFMLLTLSTDLKALLVILIAGFLGCLVDSYLGAIFQHHGWAANRLHIPGYSSLPVKLRTLFPLNDSVNFLSTGIASALAILLY